MNGTSIRLAEIQKYASLKTEKDMFHQVFWEGSTFFEGTQFQALHKLSRKKMPRYFCDAQFFRDPLYGNELSTFLSPQILHVKKE